MSDLDSDVTLNDSNMTSTEQDFLGDALGGFSAPQNRSTRNNTRDSYQTCSPYSNKKNYHQTWWSYVISIALTLLVVVALYYLNTDAATEDYKMRYKIITALILLLAVLHVLIVAY